MKHTIDLPAPKPSVMAVVFAAIMLHRQEDTMTDDRDRLGAIVSGAVYARGEARCRAQEEEDAVKGKIICPVCQREGKQSTVTPGFTTSTCLGWTPGHYDEDGSWVTHRDPNTHTTRYHCSNFHVFEIKRKEGREDEVRERDDLRPPR